jgi:putative tryptophan/tyrosine transport system substrate-binding protein
MRRREFITALGGATIAWPLAARAQQPSSLIQLAFLGPTLNNPAWIEQYQAFRTQLAEFGFRERQNITIDYLAIDDPRGPFVTVAELMRSPPDLLVATGPELALQSVVGASGFIPVVMVAINFDPVARGYVHSLARPGGNITGLVFQQVELAQKQVELLTQAFPDRTRLAVLFDALSGQASAAEQTAKALHLQVQELRLENPPYDFDAAFASAAAGGAQMVLVLSSPLFLAHRARVIELANKHRLPSMFIVKHWVQTGGLMSYGADFPLMFRRAAEYVAKILKGAKPPELPVEQATKFELVVNLKTAKAIGIELPTAILLRADEVIE